MRRLRALAVSLILVSAVVFSVRLFATVPPPGFVEVVVVTGLTEPTSFTFTPDGRMLITLKDGAIRIVKNSTLLATPAITLPVSSNSERGALGIARHPQFAVNHFVYIYYTTSGARPKNRVSRFTLNGDVISPASQFVILDDIASDAGNHNGGWIAFGPDGKLYVSTGDGGLTAENSQSLANLSGKILRINADGSIPADNPFVSTPPGARREIWCYGLRNPWRNTWDSSGRLFIGDVGGSKFEEINLGGKGLNYGWPRAEGKTGTPGFTDPVYAYAHNGAGASITVGAFSSALVYPAQYSGVLFFGDFVQSFIKTLKYNASNGTAPASPFATAAGQPVHFVSGLDGLMYYAHIGYGQSGAGQIRRLEYPSLTQAMPVPADYDGDGEDDIAVFRTPGEWLVRGFPTTELLGSFVTKDAPVQADYDGDDLADFAVYRPSASLWLILESTTDESTSTTLGGGFAMKDVPVQGDYDGDNETDLAVFSKVNARWLIKRSSDDGTDFVGFGSPLDTPVPGDYDGDTETDAAVYRPSTSQWFIRRGLLVPSQMFTLGQPGDIPVPGDYDGDGTIDAAVFRPSNANWIIRYSSNLTEQLPIPWGATVYSDVPAQADYDGDGDTDIAVYRRTTRQWFVRNGGGPPIIFP